MKSLYHRFKDAGCRLDNWQSDLYVQDSPEARKIIVEASEDEKANMNRFYSGDLWYEFPFAFEPFWEARRTTDG